MRCILVFDQLNDIIFTKCDKKFVTHIEKLGRSQGLDASEYQQEDGDLNINFIIQLFSPIVTSQRIMSSQFGNSYVSIQCQDGLNMVFDEYMGYLFVHFGFEEVQWLKRMLGICISIVQHLCGPDVSMLKMNQSRSVLVERLLDTWETLVNHDQAVLLETLEQLSVNGDLSLVAIKMLKEATEKLKSDLDQPKSHALIFVENKFLALYSSRSAKELSAGDMLFLSLLAEWCRTEIVSTSPKNESSDEYYSPDSSPQPERKPIIPQVSNGKYNDILLLSGDNYPSVSPYIVHASLVAEGVTLIILQQTQFYQLSVCLNEAFEAINVINTVSTCSTELEGAKRGMEQLEPTMKKVLESIKKLKSHNISPKTEACIKVLHVKWELLKRQWSENNGRNNLASVNSCCHSLGLCLRDMLQFTILEKSAITPTLQVTHNIAKKVSSSLSDFTSFLKVKALKNFTLGSRTMLSINKYLEEFPGLVHFLYVDRINHRIIAPTIDFQSEGPLPLTKKKIWTMVEFSRLHLQEGHLAIMWKDLQFNYAFYIWFEDTSGSPVKPKISPAQAVKSLPIPGVISGDFYQRLIEICFPKTSPGKIRCYELYCIHLGLATSSCILEQSRRLAATIWEVTGLPNNPLDLL